MPKQWYDDADDLSDERRAELDEERRRTERQVREDEDRKREGN